MGAGWKVQDGVLDATRDRFPDLWMPGNSDLCFVWPGPVAEAAAHLRGCGVEVELGPVERAGAKGDGMSVYFRDPDGSLLDKAEFTPQGINQAATNVASQQSLSWESRLDGSYRNDLNAYASLPIPGLVAA